jgi:hypothetical protein
MRRAEEEMGKKPLETPRFKTAVAKNFASEFKAPARNIC